MIEYLDTQFLIFRVGILSFIGNYIMKGDDDILDNCFLLKIEMLVLIVIDN